jgi:hypothetical protein
MGLFTFYKMQEPLPRNDRKLPSIHIEKEKSKLLHIPKTIEQDQNIDSAIKRRVQSVADCHKYSN